MKSSINRKNSPDQRQPHCRKCGGTEIGFTYTEDNYGREINEHRALQAACYYLGQYIGQTATDDGGFDAPILGHMNLVLADLLSMMRVREEQDAKAKETAEAQS